jgi:hypothetical protein
MLDQVSLYLGEIRPQYMSQEIQLIDKHVDETLFLQGDLERVNVRSGQHLADPMLDHIYLLWG